MLQLNLIHGGLSHRMSRPIRGTVSPALSVACPWYLLPLVVLVAALLFPVPSGDFSAADARQDITLIALPPGSQSVKLTDRVLLRLEHAEKKEIDPWLRDDIRIAWLTVLWSARGVPAWSWHRDASPYVAATYQVLHCAPDQVWSRIVAQRRATLGSEYSSWYAEPSSPKKPSASERNPRWRKAA